MWKRPEDSCMNYIRDWLRRTRSLRHDIYEVMIWVVGIGIVVYCFVR